MPCRAGPGRSGAASSSCPGNFQPAPRWAAYGPVRWRRNGRSGEVHRGDEHEGQRVSRRAVFAGISSSGLGALLTACGGGGKAEVATSTGEAVSPQATTAKDLTGLVAEANTCVLTPSATQGPYCFDADKIRQDIREDRQGKRLRVAVKVQASETCRPLPDVVVEIWHCDAAGLYSGAESMAAGPQAAPSRVGGPQVPLRGAGPGGGMPPDGGDTGDLTPTDDKRYLRGAQVTNADGIVEFTTIWPGWCAGRTTHIHAMVHVGNERTLTTQVMSDEALKARCTRRRRTPSTPAGTRSTTTVSSRRACS